MLYVYNTDVCMKILCVFVRVCVFFSRRSTCLYSQPLVLLSQRPRTLALDALPSQLTPAPCTSPPHHEQKLSHHQKWFKGE
jgi:hypothetical protein